MRIIIHGFYGRMGQEVRRIAEATGQAEVVGGVDCRDAGTAGLAADPRCRRTLNEFAGEADCIVDFSQAGATEKLLAYAREKRLPVVLATTGHTEKQKREIEAAGREIPIFYAANCSVGIAWLMQATVAAAAVFPEADIEIVEEHHSQKADAPSGTALSLAEAIRQVRPGAEFRIGRCGTGARSRQELGIHSVRLGQSVGTHEIRIGTPGQRLVLRHEALDRTLYAQGALRAARFLLEQKPGVYGMKDLLDKERAETNNL